MKEQSIQKPCGSLTTQFCTVAFSLLLLSAASSNSVLAAPCVAGPTTLCLNEQRFKLEVQWKTPQGSTGVGQAVPLTSDTGYFWFFSSSNVELIVKVLDARALNGHFWVFFGALSNVEYTMTVTDSVSGSTKTYFNPSGQFASVGDTSAFSASGMAHSAFQWVEPTNHSDAPLTGPSSASEAKLKTQALSTCVGTETSLCLNGGRFRVEVNWKDFQGGTGVGKAVPLTSDTGYFWFFNSANVELVVKVLDARALNQKFWVFYGALSNVEYEMTVTDTLTGNVNTYFNPSGRFASTGDTSAFAAGYSVSVQLDQSRAVSAEIPISGGTISATAADGSVFTLTIPPDGLLSAETITMTPVATIDRLPLSGGLAAGVDLAPTGLRLFEFATLTIAPARALPITEEITFAWRGSGEEFFLYPPELDTPAISMKLMHFSGYGVGRGSAADEAAQQQRVPASREDALSQRLQALLAAERRQSNIVGRFDENDRRQQIWALLLEYYNYLRHDLEFAKKSCPAAKVILPWVRSWMNEAGRFECCREEISAAIGAYIDAVVNCYNESFDKCVSQKEPKYSLDLRRFLRELQILQADNRVDRSKHERCLRFELRFESSAEFPSSQPLYRHDVVAAVPIRLSSDINGSLTGSTTLYTVKAEYLGPANPCISKTGQGNDSSFDVVKLTLNVNAYEGSGTPPEPVVMVYKPGDSFKLVFASKCPGVPDFTFPGGWWWPHHGNHASEMVGDREYEARGWKLVGQSGVYARKTHNIKEPHRENTVMELKHTPDQ